VVDSAPKDYAALARMSLAQLYGSEGKVPEAEKLLRQIIDQPTSTVSKEAAQLTLAQVLAKSKPDEARKLIMPLVAITGESRGAIIRAAVALNGELPPGPVPVTTVPVKK
jgi:predicted negative regulator of RcsB-dependent stress response